MSNPQDSIEHHVAMEVNGLVHSTAALVAFSRQKITEAMVASDRETIAAAHEQLGRMLARLPVEQKVAAE